MLKHAIQFELCLLRRSRSRLLALTAFLAIGAAAVYIGQQQVGQWQEAISIASKAQADSVSETLAYIKNGEQGPAERPWVDLTQALWQDRYADTRVAREPGALAGIATGAVDPAPAVFGIQRMADPLAVTGARIENPELAAGAVDLILVLGLLLPLLIGALGLEIGSRERETGLDRLIILQAGSTRQWLVYRMFAVTLVAAGAASCLCLVASLAGGANGFDSAWLISFAVATCAIWSGLLLAVNALVRTVRGTAFVYGVLWAALCVLLPTLAAETGLGRIQADFALAETLQARELRNEAYEQELEVLLPELYASFPSLASLPAAADKPLAGEVARHVHDGLQIVDVRKRHAQRLQQELQAQRIAEHAAWLSPNIALALGLERLAAVGPEAASAFRAYLVTAVDERVRWLLAQAWSKQVLSGEDFLAQVESAPANFRAMPSGFVKPLLILTLWAIAVWACALMCLQRYERRVVGA